MNPGSPSLADVVRGWVANAEDDLDSCEFLLHNNPAKTSLICFLAPQAAEKYIKAILLWSNIPPPKSHNITYLVGCLPAELQSAFFAIPDIDTLTIHAVEHRYSLPNAKPTSAQAMDAHQLAVAVRRLTLQLLPPAVAP